MCELCKEHTAVKVHKGVRLCGDCWAIITRRAR